MGARDAPSTLSRKQKLKQKDVLQNTQSQAPKTSLMFVAEPTEADTLADFLQLQKGMGFHAQSTPGSRPLLQGREDLYVIVDLLGLHLCANEFKKSQFMEFEIESIVKYSHNRGKKTFAFSYMDTDGLLSDYKLVTEKYFEIFEALGRAIATVIKIKNRNLVTPAKSPSTPKPKADTVHPSRLPEKPSPTSDDFNQSVRAFTSLSLLTEREEAERSAAYQSLLGNEPVKLTQTKSAGDLLPQRQGRRPSKDVSSMFHRSVESLSPTKEKKEKEPGKRMEKAASWFSFDRLFTPKRSTDQLSGSEDRIIVGLNDVPRGEKSSESPDISPTRADAADLSRSTATKVALTKFYMESRYRTIGTSSSQMVSPDGSPTTNGADAGEQSPKQTERKWKQQAGLGGFTNRPYTLQTAKSESFLNDRPTTPPSRPASPGKEKQPSNFQSTDSLDMQHANSSGSLRLTRQHESFHGLTSRKGTLAGSRSSVMTLFGNNVRDTTEVRLRSASENPKEGKYNTVSGRSGLKQRPTVVDKSRAGSEKPYDKYATVSGMKKLTGTLTVKKPKRSSVFPAFKEGESPSGSGDSLRPLVLKSVDESGREILIKNLREDGYEITAGTVDALVDALIDDPDLVYLDIFLMTFRHFVDPVDLISKLAARYRMYEARLGQEEHGREALNMNRIVAFVKKWVGEHFYDFLAPQTMTVLRTFLQDLRKGEFANYADQVESIIKYESAKDDALPTDHAEDEDLDPEELRNRILGFDFLGQSAKKLAQQLTLVDSKLFRSIRPEEFAIFLWGGTNTDKARRTRNLSRYIDGFNLVGYWVATMICSFDDLRKRIEAMEKMIKIATWCLELQNYNTAMALYSGLNTTPVLRLKRTFAGISSRHLAMFQELESKLSYKGNYKAYREIEHMARPPYLPFFGLVIKDLTFMNDGNQKTLPNGLVNFEKQRMIFNIITGIRTSQRHKFPFIADDVLKTGTSPALTPATISVATYCSNLPCLTEEQLMTLSKLIEPPGGAATAENGDKSTTPTSASQGGQRKGSIFGGLDRSASGETSQASSALLEMISAGGTVRKRKNHAHPGGSTKIEEKSRPKKETGLSVVAAESEDEGNTSEYSAYSSSRTPKSSRPPSSVVPSESDVKDKLAGRLETVVSDRGGEA
ncbi:hypothetical protein HK097_005038 [Rhizophlyctis rosea]|uniref:Uncharacterized protein n=1 Tax=Rhizophlyctis rosea TaxID=64517 RepID=A0AAD5X2L6_9FUNG|nr:hypothetical protein HK097_005038 [Rhizophlyctis rosea]